MMMASIQATMTSANIYAPSVPPFTTLPKKEEKNSTKTRPFGPPASQHELTHHVGGA